MTLKPALSMVLLSLLILAVLGRTSESPAENDGTTDENAPLSPAEAAKAFTVAEGLEFEPVLAEPVVRQPLFLDFDERGRLWVVQYLQYPYPAGLQMVSKDKFWRAVYDKVPPPPPNHFRGADRITIHEDTTGDGVFDTHKTFLDGLNIASAFARGRGGVWVLNPPYLLFYPDRDGDDVPDGDPQVHLQGFGLEDTHSVVNSLRWGPDGWLYAAQGSTVSGHVTRPGFDDPAVHSMGQLIWRYHPETKRYEIFAEGGGNAFGVEFDSQGRVYSGHNGGDTRGFHYVQGAYYQKGFAKHGPLSNPYAFGYFMWMQHEKVPRFTHNFVIYEGAALPERYHGRLLGIEPLQGRVVESDLTPDRSSFQTQDLAHPVVSSDKRFRPVDVKVGPDGGVYVADFYELQIAHGQHFQGNIEKDTGRIYRLKPRDAEPIPRFDLSRQSTAELVELLDHPNKWQRQTALRLIGDRKDASIVPVLKQKIAENDGQLALECLWALNLSGGLDQAAALEMLDHENPQVRLWTVRLLCDEKQVASPIANKLVEMAADEPSVYVRSQLASSARRLPAADGLPIVRELLARDEDADDIHIPLLLWWAIEAKAESDREAVVRLFEDSDLWRRPLVEQHILNRLMQRYAMAGGRQDLLACARLLELAPDRAGSDRLMGGFEQAFKGRSLAGLPAELVTALANAGGGSPILRLRQGDADALATALRTVGDEKADRRARIEFIETLGEVNQPQCIPVLLDALGRSQDDEVRRTVLSALQSYADEAIAPGVLELYGDFSADVRGVAQTLLASRKASARQLLAAVDAGRIDPGTLPLDTVRHLTIHNDERIADLIRKHWGNIDGASTAAMQQQIGRLSDVLRDGGGDPFQGKQLYTQSCAKCHILFGEGGRIGPELTSYKRDDPQQLLIHVVNPTAEIREGFETHLVITEDGRTVSGFLVDSDNRVVTLRGADGQNVTLPRDQIEEMVQQRKSLMPEGLLDELTEQQVRDLFAYLRSSQPLN